MVPDLADLLAGARVVRVPLRLPFRGTIDRLAVLLEGPVGWGEFAPFAEYGPPEASLWLNAAVEAAYRGWPSALRSEVPSGAIIPACAPIEAARLAAAAQSSGARTVKIKVAESGGSLTMDADRVAAVRECFAGAIRVDANGAWTPAEAVRAVRRLDRIAGGLQFVEQPCADLAGLALVRQQTDVLVAADESIRRSEDPMAAVRAAAVDVIVIKVPPLGGVRRALTVVAEAGVPVVVSSAMDTSIGLSAGIALAAALPELTLACGLGTGTLLADDVVVPTVVPRGGSLAVAGPPEPDAQALLRAESRVSEMERTAALDRLADAWEAGTRARVAGLVADSGL